MTSTSGNPRIESSEWGRKYVVFTIPPMGHEYDPQMPQTEDALRQMLVDLQAKRWMTPVMLERTERLIRAEWESMQ